MIIVHAHCEVKNGAASEFAQAAAKCVAATRQENGNNYYTLFTDSFDPLKFVVVEEWESKPALDAHMKTAHFIKFGEEINDLLATPLDVKIYEASAV